MTCTRCILDHLIDDDATRETVALWFADEPDAAKRVRAFADALRLDFREQFARFDDREGLLRAAVLLLACDRVDWLAVARKLLARFAPIPQFGYHAHVLDLAFAAWTGNVN